MAHHRDGRGAAVDQGLAAVRRHVEGRVQPSAVAEGVTRAEEENRGAGHVPAFYMERLESGRARSAAVRLVDLRDDLPRRGGVPPPDADVIARWPGRTAG